MPSTSKLPSEELPSIGKVKRSNRRYTVNKRLLVLTIVVVATAVPMAYLLYTHQRSKTADVLLTLAEQAEQQEEWIKATSYYHRYLLLKPQDSEVLVRMVEAYALGRSTPAQTNRLVGLLYRAVGRVPDRMDLKLMLAESLLEQGEFAAAELQAEGPLTRSEGSDMQAKAMRITALARYLQLKSADTEQIQSAIEFMLEATEVSPHDIELATVTAIALRENPSIDLVSRGDTASVADQIMDNLVRLDPQNTSAIIARHRYRLRYQLANTTDDLEAALKLDPNNLEAILLLADMVGQEGKDELQLEELLRRAIRTEPEDPRAYLDLARVLDERKTNGEVLELLQDGYQRTGRNFDLGVELARELISQQEFSKASRVLSEVKTVHQDELLRLDRRARKTLENRLRLIGAELTFRQGDRGEAIKELQPILTAAEVGVDQRSKEWLQAMALRAQIAQDSERWDNAAYYWRDLARAIPSNAEIASYAAAASLKSGHPLAALNDLNSYAQFSEHTPQTQVLLVQAHLALQLGRPTSERNWTEFINVLADAKQVVSDRWEILIAEVEYLLAQDRAPVALETSSNAEGDDGITKKALKLLKSAESRSAGQAEFWKAAALIYRRLGSVEDVQRSVAQYIKTEASLTKQAALQLALLTKDQKFREAEDFVGSSLPDLTTEQKLTLQQMFVEELLAGNRQAHASQLATELLSEHPEHPGLLKLGIRVSLNNSDLETAEAWENVLSRFPAERLDWSYLRSIRLLRTYEDLDSDQKLELVDLITTVRRERPRWYAVIALSGWHSQLVGDTNQAISDYRFAVELGDRSAQTLQQLVSLLYQANRLAEVKPYLSILRSQRLTAPMFDGLAIQLALGENRFAEALKMARRGVEQHPDEAMRYVWLANLLLEDSQSQEAMQVFRNAANQFPDDPQVWKGLLNLFINTGRQAEARETIAAILAGNLLPKGASHLIAGQAFEALGDAAEAKSHYELSIELQPEDLTARLSYANLLLVQGSTDARTQFEKALEISPENVEARRGLAILLANRGQEEDWLRAQQLLEYQSQESLAGNAANDRLRALLLSRQGRSRQERLDNSRLAREMLEKLIAGQPGAQGNLNRRALARILEEEAILTEEQSTLFAAREQLRTLADQQNADRSDLRNYIVFLLRHANVQSGETDLRFEVEDSESPSNDFREVFLSEAEARLADLKASVDIRQSSSAEALSYVDLEVSLLQARGRLEEARNLVGSLLENGSSGQVDPEVETQRYVKVGGLYSRLGFHDKAESVYRELMKTTPRAYVLVVRSLVEQGKSREAIEVCLSSANGAPSPEHAMLLAQVTIDARGTETQFSKAEAVIEEALANHQNNIPLLQTVAVTKATRGEYEQAIAICRQIIGIDPENALALNNLATLLAERPDQQAEALSYVERAIEVIGRTPSLLDTLGTIHLKADDHTQAIACLEEATAGRTSDARYYFHLALAYQQAGRNDEAKSTLESARMLGLENSVLTEDDLRMLAQLDQQLTSSSERSVGTNR